MCRSLQRALRAAGKDLDLGCDQVLSQLSRSPGTIFMVWQHVLRMWVKASVSFSVHINAGRGVALERRHCSGMTGDGRSPVTCFLSSEEKPAGLLTGLTRSGWR